MTIFSISGTSWLSMKNGHSISRIKKLHMSSASKLSVGSRPITKYTGISDAIHFSETHQHRYTSYQCIHKDYSWTCASSLHSSYLG